MMKKFEISLLILFTVSVLANLFAGISLGYVFATMMPLAMFYMFAGVFLLSGFSAITIFDQPSYVTLKRSIVSFVMAVVYGETTSMIFWTCDKYVGGPIMLIASAVVLILSLAVALSKSKGDEVFYRKLIIRNVYFLGMILLAVAWYYFKVFSVSSGAHS